MQVGVEKPAQYTALTKPNIDDSSRYGACSTTTRSTTMAHKLRAQFGHGEMVSDQAVNSYYEWANLRKQSDRWQEYNLGYCAAAAVCTDDRDGRIAVVCYLFKNSRDLRRFKLWCDLHGLEVEDCSDVDNAKKNT